MIFRWLHLPSLDGWHKSCAVPMVLAAGDLSLAYIGGLVRSFLALLDYFGGVTEIYLSTFFGGTTPVS